MNRIGARYSRSWNLDNGVWMREGDSCLPGPQRFGTVVRIYEEKSRYGGMDKLVDVSFDDGGRGTFFQD